MILHARALLAVGRVTEALAGLASRAGKPLGAGAVEVVELVRAVAAMQAWVGGTVVCGKG